MPSKKILYGNDARQALKRGIDRVASVTNPTEGPVGRNIMIQKGYGEPASTNDGVSGSRETTLKDPHEAMGAEIVKAVAEKTNNLAGDGTTASINLTQAIYSEALEAIENGVNVLGVKSGINKASAAIIEALKQASTPVSSNDELRFVAAISAESKELGDIIVDTVEKIGRNGTITVEASQSLGVTSVISQGMEFDRGYFSPYMAKTQENPEATEVELKDPVVLVTDKTIGNVKELVPILEAVAQSGKRDMLIIAEDIVGDALATIIINRARGNFNVVGVKAPGFGERKKDYLNDIATLVGANFISSDVGMSLDKVGLADLGNASRVVVNKDKTVIVGGKGDKAKVDARIATARKILETTESKHDKLKIEERIAKLSGGVAVIKVGAATEIETKYMKDKIEDAVNATKAAIEEGIVAGGGIALVKAAQEAMISNTHGFKSKDEKTGYYIVMRAIESPLKQIALNAGKKQDETKWFKKFFYQRRNKGQYASTIISKVKAEAPNDNYGYDALNDVMVDDMIKSGIIDPVKVVRIALEHASSAASTLITTEVAIAEDKDDFKFPGA